MPPLRLFIASTPDLLAARDRLSAIATNEGFEVFTSLRTGSAADERSTTSLTLHGRIAESDLLFVLLGGPPVQFLGSEIGPFPHVEIAAGSEHGLFMALVARAPMAEMVQRLGESSRHPDYLEFFASDTELQALIETHARNFLQKTRLAILARRWDSAQWDTFISHASEDKAAVAQPLAALLEQQGYQVWHDESVLTLGDSLRRSIDHGLANSRFGVVILSPAFFQKEWPRRELDGLVAREGDGSKVVLPVWHELTTEELRRLAPTLADRVFISTRGGLDRVCAKVSAAIGPPLRRR